jgi:hypothetical protein
MQQSKEFLSVSSRAHLTIYLWGENLAKFERLKNHCREGFDHEGREISDASLLRALVACAPRNSELRHRAREQHRLEKASLHLPRKDDTVKVHKKFSCGGRLLKWYYKLQAFCSGMGKRIPGVVIIRAVLMSTALTEEMRSFVHAFCAKENMESAEKYRRTFHRRLKTQ